MNGNERLEESEFAEMGFIGFYRWDKIWDIKEGK